MRPARRLSPTVELGTKAETKLKFETYSSLHSRRYPKTTSSKRFDRLAATLSTYAASLWIICPAANARSSAGQANLASREEYELSIRWSLSHLSGQFETSVERAQRSAGWAGLHLELPYPGRWKRHRVEFQRQLMPVLLKTLGQRSHELRLS